MKVNESLLEPLLRSGWELEDAAGTWLPERVDELTATLAARLAARGLAGRRVLVPLTNGALEVIALLSCLRAGCLPIVTKPFPALRVEQLAQRTGAAAVVGAALPPAAGPALAVRELDAPARRREEPGRLGLTTSGTTGFPKVVVHAFESVLWNASSHAAAVGLGCADRLFVSLPCAHSYALVSQLFAGMLAGCRLRLVAGLEPFPLAHLQQLAAWEATCTAFTPRSLINLLALERDLPAGLRWATVGSDRLSTHWHARFLERSGGGCSLYVTYGFSEAGPRVLTLDTAACSAEQLAAAGLPLPGVEAELRPFGSGLSHELWVKTASRMEGYLDDPQATGRTIEGEWLRSRDGFRRDADGVLFFLGRLDDAVTLDGLTFFPAEVEKALELHPRVHAARVGTDPGEAGRAVLKAWIQAEGDAGRPLAAELRSFLMSRLERTMVPQRIEFVDAPVCRK